MRRVNIFKKLLLGLALMLSTSMALAYNQANSQVLVSQAQLAFFLDELEAGINIEAEPSLVSAVLQQQAIRSFQRQNYREQKELVDKAARLVAFGYLELKVSLREITFMHLEPKDLPAFIKVEKTPVSQVQAK